ncbi:hypothetical protein HanXRQr2_Chr13g0616481 [Helianthus annuus]|uniref:Uncharacterized protein n=1 Tax=Helianthus annuus TaxID=4232 RepID=A0A9K3EM24_HELAN|nr:hypothetical protein HanXRQr2_Chr13g0616481 [Helianthus annuus]
MSPLSLTLFSYIFFPNQFRFESTNVKTNFFWKWFLSGKKVGFKSRFNQLGSGLKPNTKKPVFNHLPVILSWA